MRDQSLLEVAIKQAEHKHACSAPFAPDPATAYTYAIAKAHAFVDGNKRTAFVTAATFLRLNGFGLRPDPFDGVGAMEDLASGALTEGAFRMGGATDYTHCAPSRRELTCEGSKFERETSAPRLRPWCALIRDQAWP
ncbi:MAG TPA: type II toxin-antitoxin system death-on-curing family toxin [Paracoccus sp.]|nr:type II toxin-antitoxin system death-on-curing family toxin [Paracoccus sp. (in: a-proteobacteria)]